MKDGEFLVEWLNHMKRRGLEGALDSGVEALSRRPLPRDYFKRIGMRLEGKAVPLESEASRREARGFLARHFIDDTFLFWLCIFCLNMEAGRRTIRKRFGYTLPGIGDAYTWKRFLRVLRTHLPGAEKWVESDVIRLRLSESRMHFDATFRSGGRGRLLFEFVPANERSRALQALGRLIESDSIGRVHECPSCWRFFFAGQRKHKRFCSHRCQTASWQGTREGRAKRAAYMQAYRANPRVRARSAAPKGYQRKRGRKLHDTLKKGE
jgi:hypothetical protein